MKQMLFWMKQKPVILFQWPYITALLINFPMLCLTWCHALTDDLTMTRLCLADACSLLLPCHAWDFASLYLAPCLEPCHVHWPVPLLYSCLVPWLAWLPWLLKTLFLGLQSLVDRHREVDSSPNIPNPYRKFDLVQKNGSKLNSDNEIDTLSDEGRFYVW